MEELNVCRFNLSTIRLGLWLGLAALLTGEPTAQPAVSVLAAPLRNQLERPAALIGSPRTGIVVPFYIYPGPEWDRLVQARNTYPRVPMIAVINPNSGPGSAQDPNYVTGIQTLRSAGIVVLGYVYTGWAARPADTVKGDVNAYRTWYDLDGIFFDQMSGQAGNESYYSDLSSNAKSLGFQFTMGNPATDIPSSYVGTMDNLNIYENVGLPSLASLDGWHEGYSKYNFSMLAHGVDSFDPAFVSSASNYVGYLYLTNDVSPNPYDVLPSYFEQLVAALNNLAPVAHNTFTVNGQATLNVAAPGVLAYDTDPDGDPLTAVLAAGPTNGTLTLNADGSFTYTPLTSLLTFTDTFTYRAFDGKAYSNIATVTIQVIVP